MSWRAQIDDRGIITRYKDTDTGEVITAKEYERRMAMGTQMGGMQMQPQQPMMYAQPAGGMYGAAPQGQMMMGGGQPVYQQPMQPMQPMQQPMAQYPQQVAPAVAPLQQSGSPLMQPGAQILTAGAGAQSDVLSQPAPQQAGQPGAMSPLNNITTGMNPTAGKAIQGKSLRMEGVPTHQNGTSIGYKNHGFLDATSIAILLPTLVLLALIIAAAHKKRLFPWQTIRTFNPPSGLMSPRDYERSYLCPPNLRRHGRLGKRNPNATWTDQDGVVLPFGFLARTHLPVTIPMGRLPNKNMFLVAPSGSGKTTLMRAIIKALLAKPCVIIALEAKANDPNLDEKKEGFKYTVLPEAQHAGFDTLYFNPLDSGSIHWNPLDLAPVEFASSIVQDVNSLPPEEQHWAERDHGYIFGLCQLLKWGAVQVTGEDENGGAAEFQALPCNPRGLMRLVNNRRNIVESLRRLKSNPEVDAGELSELTQTLSSIIRTDTDWDKNIQGVRGRLRMFKNPNVLRVTEQSNVDIKAAMHHPTVLIFGAPASLGPDAESLAACFVYQLQQALHTRYGTKSVLPLFAFFDEYQTLNIDLAGRLSAIVRGANGGLTVILQNISQITKTGGSASDPAGGGGGGAEMKTIFSNSAIRVCLHNADETTAAFFSNEIGKHAVVVPGISDHYQATGFGIFPTSWNRIHSQQVVARVDTDSIKRMEKQHALVFLAPAGDPEFGEVKPLMVDLRGIEEIARLHLLHNVSARKGGDEVPPPEGTPPHGAPPFGAPLQPGMPGLPGVPQVAGVPTTPMPGMAAASAAGRMCQHCNKPAGKGKFCIECGQFIGAAAAATEAQPAVELATSAQIMQPAAEEAYGQTVSVGEPAHAQPAPPPFPAFARTNPGIAEAHQAIAQSPYQAPAMQTQAPAAPGVAQPTAQPGVIQGARRQPVTSFNLDPSKLGYSQQQQPNGGVEF
jgi:hypothetical protein